MSVGVYVVCARASSWITSSCSSYGSACSNDVKPSITVVRSTDRTVAFFRDRVLMGYIPSSAFASRDAQEELVAFARARMEAGPTGVSRGG